MNNKEIVTPQDYADKCGVCLSTIYNRIATGEIIPLLKGGAYVIDLSTTPIKGGKKRGRAKTSDLLNKI